MEKRFLLEAIRLAEEKMLSGEGGPFGAVVTRGGEIVARGWNRVTSANDPTAHAEVSAIRAACAALGVFSLAGCELYASCEPCPMCLAACYWARLDRVYYACGREDAAEIGFDDAFLYRELALPAAERSLPLEQALRAEGLAVFAAWRDKADKVRY